MVRSAWLSVIPVALIVGCQSRSLDLTYLQQTAIADEIRQVADQFLRRSESGDVAGWMALFSSEENMRYAISGSVWTLDALEVDHRALMESQQEASWVWDDVHVVLLSADVAVFTGCPSEKPHPMGIRDS